MILIVEDSLVIRKLIVEILAEKNIPTIEAINGEQALKLMKKNVFDLIIVDIMMPKINGLELTKIIREFSNIPIIFLTALSDENNQVQAYNSGADAYITKPFSPHILLSIVGRFFEKKENIKTIGDLEIFFKSKKVLLNKKEIVLPTKERDILFYLVEHMGVVKTRDQILNAVWGYDYFGDDRSVDKHISRLRIFLEDGGSYIKTIKKIGYKFEV